MRNRTRLEAIWIAVPANVAEEEEAMTKENTMRTRAEAAPVPPALEATREMYVVHPLDDVPEEKCSPEGWGPMHMGAAQRIGLMSLRGYLVLMMLLVLFKAVTLSGLFGLHALGVQTKAEGSAAMSIDVRPRGLRSCLGTARDAPKPPVRLRKVLTGWGRALVVRFGSATEPYLCGGSASPSSRDALLLLIIWRHDSVAWSKARVELANRLLSESHDLIDPWDRITVMNPWLWRSVADQLIASAVDRGVVRVEHRPGV